MTSPRAPLALLSLLASACADVRPPAAAPGSLAAPLAAATRDTERVPQRHGGVLVRGGGQTFDRDASGRVVRHLDQRVSGLSVSPTPTIARASLEERLAPRRLIEAELVVLPWRPGGVLAWDALVAGSPPHRVRLDAHTGRVLADGPIGHAARARVYEQHPLAGDPIEVELVGLAPGADTLQGDDLFVASLVFQSDGTPAFVQHATADRGGDFLYGSVV